MYKFLTFILISSISLVGQSVSSIPAASGGGGGGGVSSVATGCGLSGGPIVGTGTIVARAVANAQTGTTYTLDAADCGKLVTTSNASAITLTVPAAGGSFVDGWYVDVLNIGAGTVTASGATATLTTGQSARFVSTGATWRVLLGSSSATAAGCGFGLVVNGPDCDVNTAVIPSNALLQSGAPLYCAGSASNTATCTMTPTLTAYTNGQTVLYKAGATNATTHTLNIDTLGAKSILTASAGALSAGDVTSGNYYELTYDGTQFRLPASGGGSAITFNSPYMVVGGTNYLFGSYPATIPPASGSWTLASTQAADAVEAAGAALRVRMSTGSTAINIYSIPMGTSRTVTAVVMGDPAFSANASCYIGTGRTGAGAPTFWATQDNRSGGAAPQLLGLTYTPGPTFSYSALPVAGIAYAAGVPLFLRMTITGGNTLHQKSGDYGLTWTTFATTANTTVFGGAVANTDLWYFGGQQGTSGLASSCTLLSWSTT
jgi:hypothetical protein